MRLNFCHLFKNIPLFSYIFTTEARYLNRCHANNKLTKMLSTYLCMGFSAATTLNLQNCIYVCDDAVAYHSNRLPWFIFDIRTGNAWNGCGKNETINRSSVSIWAYQSEQKKGGHIFYSLSLDSHLFNEMILLFSEWARSRPNAKPFIFWIIIRIRVVLLRIFRQLKRFPK